jgi:hypothetical protein
VIAPESMEALTEVAKALGFEFHGHVLGKPIGIDYDRAQEQVQCALLREGAVQFDGTARECAAFLIGWRDRGRMLLRELAR